MMRRLFWVGVGVGVTVLVVRKGRAWWAAAVPAPATAAVTGTVRLTRTVDHVLEQFRAGRDEKAAELTNALIGGRDVAELRATAPAHRASLRAHVAGTDPHAARTDARIRADWSQAPTDDPDDDDGYAFS